MFMEEEEKKYYLETSEKLLLYCHFEPAWTTTSGKRSEKSHNCIEVEKLVPFFINTPVKNVHTEQDVAVLKILRRIPTKSVGVCSGWTGRRHRVDVWFKSVRKLLKNSTRFLVASFLGMTLILNFQRSFLLMMSNILFIFAWFIDVLVLFHSQSACARTCAG